MGQMKSNSKPMSKQTKPNKQVKKAAPTASKKK